MVTATVVRRYGRIAWKIALRSPGPNSLSKCSSSSSAVLRSISVSG